MAGAAASAAPRQHAPKRWGSGASGDTVTKFAALYTSRGSFIDFERPRLSLYPENFLTVVLGMTVGQKAKVRESSPQGSKGEILMPKRANGSGFLYSSPRDRGRHTHAQRPLRSSARDL